MESDAPFRSFVRRHRTHFIAGHIVIMLTCVAALAYTSWIVYEHFCHERPIGDFERGLMPVGALVPFVFYQMGAAIIRNLRGRIPASYTRLDASCYPTVERHIADAARSYGCGMPRMVFTDESAEAYLFSPFSLCNVFEVPEKYLLLGLELLVRLPDDQLRAVIFHEMAHYAQEETGYMAKAAAMSHFANDLSTHVKAKKKGTVWPHEVIPTLYNQFLTVLAYQISNGYAPLDDLAEKHADRMATAFIPAEIYVAAITSVADMTGCEVNYLKLHERFSTLLPDHDFSYLLKGRALLSLHIEGIRGRLPLFDSGCPLQLDGKPLDGIRLKRDANISMTLQAGIHCISLGPYASATMYADDIQVELIQSKATHVHLRIEFDHKHSRIHIRHLTTSYT